VLLRAVAIRHDRHQTRPIGIAHLNRDPLAHPRPSQGCDERTPIGDSYVRLYPLADRVLQSSKRRPYVNNLIATTGRLV
jgi:hypothetical protein